MKAGVRLVLLQLQIGLVSGSLLLAHDAGSPVHCRMLGAGRHVETVKNKHLYKTFKTLAIERKVAKKCGREVRDK